MKKFKLVGDPNNKSRFSSKIIIDSLNDAAKKINLYSEKDLTVVYDGCCNNHGYNADAFICTYEICFPNILLQNAKDKPIIGVSQDNKRFIVDGGHPENLAGYFKLGVDSSLYPKVEKTKNNSLFVVGVYTESLVRGGVELCLQSFEKAFGNNKDVKLIIKDRNATERFEQYIKNYSRQRDLQVEYQNSHFNNIEEIIEWFSGIDCHLYMNRSSTWAMPPCESMTMGIPTLAVSYSGPREYIFHKKTGLEIPYTEKFVGESIDSLLNIGCRNFFFDSGYRQNPTWAEGDIEKTAILLNEIKKDDELRKSIANSGRQYAINNLTWEQSAKNLSLELDKWF
jgi:glycosyltransferase involved in cell wall biosynthesis